MRELCTNLNASAHFGSSTAVGDTAIVPFGPTSVWTPEEKDRALLSQWAPSQVTGPSQATPWLKIYTVDLGLCDDWVDNREMVCNSCACAEQFCGVFRKEDQGYAPITARGQCIFSGQFCTSHLTASPPFPVGIIAGFKRKRLRCEGRVIHKQCDLWDTVIS